MQELASFTTGDCRPAPSHSVVEGFRPTSCRDDVPALLTLQQAEQAEENTHRHTLCVTVLPLAREITWPDALLNNSKHPVGQLRQHRGTSRSSWGQQRKKGETVCVSAGTVPVYPRQPCAHFLSLRLNLVAHSFLPSNLRHGYVMFICL